MYDVFFDDIRDAPDGWTLVRDPEQLKDMLISGVIRHLSMDHDLGLWDEQGNEITGYSILCWVEKSNHLPKGTITVHSMNSVGRAKMVVVVQRLNKQ